MVFLFPLIQFHNVDGDRMSKPQSFKRIIVEDFPEAERALVGKIASSINIFADEILNILDKNLSIDDNLAQAKKTFTVTVDSNGIPKSSLVLTSGLKSTCVGMQVIYATNQTNVDNSPTSTPFITFRDSSGQITISKITGLAVNNIYQLRAILYT